jgi:hypothetical protein
MVAVQKPRDVEVRADILDDDIRGDAPPPDGHIAIRQSEPLQSGRISAPDDLKSRADGMRQPVASERAYLLQIPSKLAGNTLLTLSRSIGKLGAQRGPRIDVDTKRRGAFGK